MRQAIHALQNLLKGKSIEGKNTKQLLQTRIAAFYLNMKLKAGKKKVNLSVLVKVHTSFNWNQTKTMCSTAYWEMLH